MQQNVFMRQYEPIWYKLKSLPLKDARTIGVSITANRRLHPRIIKAVTKEKWKDMSFKIEKDHKCILSHISKGAIITFYLDISLKTLNEKSV